MASGSAGGASGTLRRSAQERRQLCGNRPCDGQVGGGKELLASAKPSPLQGQIPSTAAAEAPDRPMANASWPAGTSKDDTQAAASSPAHAAAGSLNDRGAALSVFPMPSSPPPEPLLRTPATPDVDPPPPTRPAAATAASPPALQPPASLAVPAAWSFACPALPPAPAPGRMAGGRDGGAVGTPGSGSLELLLAEPPQQAAASAAALPYRAVRPAGGVLRHARRRHAFAPAGVDHSEQPERRQRAWQQDQNQLSVVQLRSRQLRSRPRRQVHCQLCSAAMGTLHGIARLGVCFLAVALSWATLQADKRQQVGDLNMQQGARERLSRVEHLREQLRVEQEAAAALTSENAALRQQLAPLPGSEVSVLPCNVRLLTWNQSASRRMLGL